MAVFAIPFGILSDRRGRKRLLILGSLGAAPIFFVFALTTNVAAMVAAGALGGICEGTYLATVNATIADQTPQENRNSAFTLSFIIGGAGGSLGTAFPLFVPSLSNLLGIGLNTLNSSFLLLLGVSVIVLTFVLYDILRGVRETIKTGGTP